MGTLAERARALPNWLAKLARTTLEDHPHIVNLIVLVLTVSLSALSALFWPVPIEALEEDGLSLALGVLSLAGILAGFVGIVVVFGLQASAPVFVRFRVASGRSLGRNWLVLIATGFAAAGSAMLSAIAYSTDLLVIGIGALFLSTLLCVHAALRMLWLVRVLIDAVRLDDSEKSKPARTKSAADRYTPTL